ncbi:MAG: hypothetical protein ACRENG_25090, partial [bacterium]
MKMTIPIKKVFVLLLILTFSAGLAAAGERARVTERRTYSQRIASVPGKTLYIDMSQADIIVTGQEQNEIVAEATVELSKADPDLVKEFFASTQLVLEPYRQGFRATLKTPRDKYQRSDSGFRRMMNLLFDRNADGFSMSTALRVQVPASQALVVENQYGDITVESVNGTLQIENTSGEVAVEGCQGSLDLQNNYAAVEIRDFQGAVTVRNSSGAVTVANITGDARVDNSYKPVSFQKIGGTLSINGQSSEVSGTGVSGDCLITSSYKPISVSGIGGKLTVNGQSCGVTVA